MNGRNGIMQIDIKNKIILDTQPLLWYNVDTIREVGFMKYRLTGREDATEWMWKLVAGENNS